jgi:hypothetical protein
MRPVHAPICLAIAASVAGCLGPSNTLVPGNEGAPGIKRFLVCAPNTAITLPAELADATGTLREQVDAYLHFHSRDAQWINLYESQQLWSEAVAAATQEGAVEKAPEFFAKRLDQKYQFDAIVMPSILLHKVRASYGGASWDGVHRQMEIVNAPSVPNGRAQDTFAEGVAQGGVSGEVMATSIHVLVFSRAGERIFEGRGGFAFVHDADLANARKRSWSYRLRDLAADIDAMREGIAIAFDPYLPEAD